MACTPPRMEPVYVRMMDSAWRDINAPVQASPDVRRRLRSLELDRKIREMEARAERDRRRIEYALNETRRILDGRVGHRGCE